MYPTLAPLTVEKTTPEINPSKQMSGLETIRKTYEDTRELYENGKCSVLDVLDKRTDLELARSLYDETNAYVQEAFPEIVKKLFIDRGIEFDSQTGFIKPHELDKQKNVWTVTLPNLPVVNSHESHLGGNRDLRQTTDIIEKAADKYDPFVVHMKGGDFNFYAQTDDKRIIQNIENAAWEKIRASHESPYLVACSASLETTITTFNTMQAIRALESPTEIIITAHEARKELTGILVSLLAYQRENKKAMEICSRFIEASKSGVLSEKDLETYFNSYAKMYFEERGFSTYASTQALAKDSKETEHEIRLIGDIKGIKALEEESTDNTKIHLVITELIKGISQEDTNLAIRGKHQVTQKTLELLKTPLHELKAQVENLGLKKDFINESDFKIETTAAQLDEYVTEHTKQTTILTNAVYKIRADFNTNKMLTDEQLASLLAISRYPNDIKTQILIELESGNTKELEKLIALSEKRLEIYTAKHDKLTGLPTRYEFYRESNEWIRETIEAGEQLGMVSIDLGFLNYFNKQGNREVGDRAIKVSVMQIEQELQNRFGDDWNQFVKVYRYAGDEISILFKGGNDSKNKLEELFRDLNASGQNVLPTKKANPLYLPEQIQYNFGICDMYFGEQGLERLLDTKNIYNVDEEKILRKILEVRTDLRNTDYLQNLDLYQVYNKGMRDLTINAAKAFFEQHGAANKQKEYDEIIWGLEHGHPTNYVQIMSSLKAAATAEYKTVKNETIEKMKNLELTKDEQMFYYNTLGKVMTRISDRFVDHNKVYERFHLLYDRYTDIVNTTDEAARAQKKAQLDVLLTFSGKAFFGKNAEFLERIHAEQTNGAKESHWQTFKRLLLTEASKEEQGEMRMSKLSHNSDDLPNSVLNVMVRDVGLEILNENTG